MKNHSIVLFVLPLLLAGCGVTRIVTVAPAPEPAPVVTPAPTTTVVVAQPQMQVVYAQPVSTTVTYPRSQTTRVTTIDVTPLTSDISLYLDLQAVAAAFAQANTVEEFEMILNSNSYIISNLDLNHDGFIDYLRVLETLEGHTHVILIQAVLAANIYQDVATLVVEMGFSTPYVQIIGAPYVYGANYIIEPVFCKRPPLFDRFGRPTYAYWRSPYYWDHFPHHYNHHAPYHLGHYQAYVTTYMQNHRYCHDVRYVEQYHYSSYAEVARPVSRGDYAQRYPEQSFARRSTATYTPAGSQTATRVTNARQLRQAVEQSGASRTTTTTNSRSTTTAQPTRSTDTQQTSAQRPATNATQATSATRQTGTSQQTTRTAKESQPASATTTTRVRTSGTTTTTRTPATSTTASRSSSTRSALTSTSTSTSTSRGSSTGTRTTGTNTNTRNSTQTRSR